VGDSRALACWVGVAVRWGLRLGLAIRRIAVTGGPGAGKTTLWQELSASYADRVVAVPEVATLMFRHVFPTVHNEGERRAVQSAIFHVQRELERVHEGRATGDQILLCDRGTVDGGGYWPAGHEAFFQEMATSWQSELARYDAVLFLESAAVGGLSIAAGNEVRREDLAQAIAIDARLRETWASHPHFCHVPHAVRFADKLAEAHSAFAKMLHRG
jgi:predicted ATPase